MLASTARVSRGRLAVRCVVAGPGARSCTVRVLAGRRKIGTGTARTKGGIVTIPVRLTATGRRLLARARHGLAVRVTATAAYAGGKVTTSRTTRLRGR